MKKVALKKLTEDSAMVSWPYLEVYTVSGAKIGLQLSWLNLHW